MLNSRPTSQTGDVSPQRFEHPHDDWGDRDAGAHGDHGGHDGHDGGDFTAKLWAWHDLCNCVLKSV